VLPRRALIDPPPLFHCKLYLRGSVSWEGMGPGLPRRSLFASPIGYSTVNCAWCRCLGRCVPWVTPPVSVCFPPLCVGTHWLFYSKLCVVQVPEKLRALGYPEQVWKTVRQSFGDKTSPHRWVTQVSPSIFLRFSVRICTGLSLDPDPVCGVDAAACC
jgi:hypothetical protein